MEFRILMRTKLIRFEKEEWLIAIINNKFEKWEPILNLSEIKKKSGGSMRQGSTVKCSGFGYSMIDLMKVSGSSVFNSNFEDCKDKSIVRESILYSSEDEVKT
nr:uncharacterized protein LOC109159029 [Ipomoea batatas]GMD82628.1 uncharacterized protein LOC109159029 [Ipomoea batatas]